MSKPTFTPPDFRTALRHCVPRAISVACPYPIARGEGSFVYTTEGKRLIDFIAGIAVMNVGHAHPKVTEAVQKAAAAMTHTAFQVMGYESYVPLLWRLFAYLPQEDENGESIHWKGMFFNSGAEAVENAMKVARWATGRTTFLSFEHAFHGRTYGAMSLSSKPVPYRAGFGPFVPEVVQLPYPTRYRCLGCAGAPSCDCAKTTMAKIEQVFKTRVPAKEVAAVFIEPIVGEGGFYVPPDDFLPALRGLCDQHGILLVVDEIQTGVCRTGSFFRFLETDVVPDMVLTAKALGGGLPLSGVLGKAGILDAAPRGSLGGTFGGNPVAIAAAHAVLDIVQDEDLSGAARRKGAIARERMLEWQRAYPVIGDARGAGLLLAMEFVKDPETKEPYPEIVPKIIARCYERGLAVLSAGTFYNCIRLMPALNIPDEVLNEGLDILGEVIAEVVEG